MPLRLRQQPADCDDDELSKRITDLKLSIRALESRQEQMLDRIDARIHTRDNQAAEQVAPRQSEHDKFDSVYRKTLDKSKYLYQKYADELDLREATAQQHRRYGAHKESPTLAGKRIRNAEVQVDTLEVNQQQHDRDRPNGAAGDEHCDSARNNARAYKSNLSLERRSRVPYRKVLDFDRLLASNDFADNPEFETPNKTHADIDYANRTVADRNDSESRSRSNNRSTSSSRLNSPGSDLLADTASKNLFGSDGMHDKYELVNDSFGSPDPKQKTRPAVDHAACH